MTPSRSFRINKYVLFSLVILTFVATILVWISISRIDDFKAYHLAIANESAAAAALDISSFISEKKRLVNIFGQDHLALINRLARNPENVALHHQLRDRIGIYFPEFFTFTITRSDGTPYLEDFDGLVGEMCLTDLRSFAETDKQLPRIHPHPEVYHFDISARLPGELILFISFHTDILGSILGIAQTPGHELMLLSQEAANLIEVTEKGARINTPRDDYRLTANERQRILYSKPIPGTRWTVADLHQADLFSAYQFNAILNYSFIYAMFFFVVAIMVFVIRKEEKLRLDAEKHKDDFLSVINHELRTPITSIKGALGLVANGITGEINEKTRELITIALNNSERLNLLINDLLDIKKFESGKMELNLIPTQINDFVESCINTHQGYAVKHNVQFQLRHTQTGLFADIDPDRMEQVISNLLSNAAKYGAEQDHIIIDVSKTSDNIRISITDHGPGIPEGFKDRIFQKFTQSSIEHHKGGTGLGLSIVKMIVEAHDGKINFTSQSGKGTTFVVDLPRKR